MYTTQQYVKFKCWWRPDFKIETLKVTFNLKYSLNVQESDPSTARRSSWRVLALVGDSSRRFAGVGIRGRGLVFKLGHFWLC